MLKVGLTGGIGSGKSTVSNIMKERGIAIVDADKISKEIYTLHPELLGEIRRIFGEGFISYYGELKRRELGNYIFRYPAEREKLEKLVIPLIKSEINKQVEEYDRTGAKICVIDAPTLIENGMHNDMNINILVWVDMNTQISRVQKRDGLGKSGVIDRINSQMSLDKKKEYVDFIIDNGSDVKSTKEQVDNIINILLMYVE